MKICELPLDERPRERLFALGAESLSDAELLAICLRTGMRGQSALDISRTLLRTYNGMAKLVAAPAQELARLPGLGPAKASQLKAALELARRALASNLNRQTQLSSPRDSADYLHARLRLIPYEVFACLFLDSRHRVIAFEELFRGTIDGASVHPREVVRRALAHNAAAVILAHNHPSGHIEASAADKAITQKLQSALSLIDVRVLDHFVVGVGEPLSFAENGYL